jgi:ElaB/YqjD/DUF883 family membrane-anchored ribosome-binding protein
MNRNKHKAHTDTDVDDLADDARALMAATADVAGEKVEEARKRLSVALESIRNRVASGAQAIDEAVHERPYHAVAIGFGIGAIVGCMLARRSRGNDD